ncbi:MAG: hypothetical protein K1W24_02085 [Lachnospiraceae bacterium]
MVIMHNMAAEYTGRQLDIIGKNKALRSEHLSSGYRINRAADDAASLSISEKMRGQIRGLLRGSTNVQDGCSLIDTADGAMSEQAGILQRIRELTIQAYNDTYTQSDRLQIQKEVDAHLKELDRIAKETEFNTQKILQGNKKTVTITTEVIEPAEEYHYEYETIQTKKVIPEWFKKDCDMNLKKNNQRVGSSVKQDIRDYVIINENKVDPSKPEVFYGPKDKIPDGFKGEYGGEWTEKIEDNYSAVISFNSIAECGKKEDLLNKLIDMSGVAIAYECATCYDRAQGFYFDSDDVSVSSIYTLEDLDGKRQGIQYSYPHISSDIQRINLQSYINMAGELLDEEAYKESAGASTGKSYADYLKEEAGKIAAGIVKEITEKSPSYHFIRVTDDKDNPYNVVFYDFRDDGTTKTELAGDAIGNAYINMSIQKQVKSEPQVIEHVNEEYSGLYIQAGANTDQGIIIDLPDTTLAGLGLEGYTVFREGYCSAGKNEMYDQEIIDGAEYLGGNKWYNPNVGGHMVESKETISGTRVIMEYETVLVHPGGTNADGERVNPKYSSQVKSQKTESYSYTVTTTRMEGGHQATFTVYEPDTLLRVDRAIERLSERRADLGAMRNRLEHAYLNDTNGAENLQAAESKMRDANYADEIVAYSMSNILEQVSQSVLAQTNRSRDGIMALLNA